MYSEYINIGLIQAFKYLKNLLEWSRLQTKRVRFNPSTVNLNKLVNEIVEMLFTQAQLKDIKINTEVSEDLQIFADEIILKTVLVNIVSNSIKYSFKNGELNIRCIKNGNEEVAIYVKDNGMGMSPEKSRTLFNISETKSLPGTNNETGTGLGLIICNEFVKMHNGHISVESELNKGSTFRVVLPVNQL